MPASTLFWIQDIILVFNVFIIESGAHLELSITIICHRKKSYFQTKQIQCFRSWNDDQDEDEDESITNKMRFWFIFRDKIRMRKCISGWRTDTTIHQTRCCENQIRTTDFEQAENLYLITELLPKSQRNSSLCPGHWRSIGPVHRADEVGSTSLHLSCALNTAAWSEIWAGLAQSEPEKSSMLCWWWAAASSLSACPEAPVQIRFQSVSHRIVWQRFPDFLISTFQCTSKQACRPTAVCVANVLFPQNYPPGLVLASGRCFSPVFPDLVEYHYRINLQPVSLTQFKAFSIIRWWNFQLSQFGIPILIL